MMSPMVMERSRRDSEHLLDGSFDGLGACLREADGGIATIAVSSSLSSRSSSSSPSSSSGFNCINHRVSKMDTLAGVAIKYGVEVSDIKRLNGLVSDLQMFAHKSLQIPLPGRHLPSPFIPSDSVENEDDSSSLQRPCNDVLDLIESFNLRSPPSDVSPAMSRLQCYYGLTPSEGAEAGRCCVEDELSLNGSSTSDLCPSRHRKSKSLVNGFTLENCDDDALLDAVANNSETDCSVRRRQKTDGNQFFHTPELLMEDSNGGGFVGRTGKGLAPRPKQGSKGDIDMGQAGACTNSSNIVKTDYFSSVRKSSSTSCLQDSENNFSVWPAGKWILKPEVIAGFQSMGGKRNKAALD